MRFILLFLLLGLAACERPPEHAQSIPLDQIPAVMQKAFQNAKKEPRSLADQVVASVRQGNFAAALLQLQTLAGIEDLNQEQRDVTARVVVTLNENLDRMSLAQTPAPDAATAKATVPVPAPTPEAQAEANAIREQYRRTK